MNPLQNLKFPGKLFRKVKDKSSGSIFQPVSLLRQVVVFQIPGRYLKSSCANSQDTSVITPTGNVPEASWSLLLSVCLRHHLPSTEKTGFGQSRSGGQAVRLVGQSASPPPARPADRAPSLHWADLPASGDPAAGLASTPDGFPGAHRGERGGLAGCGHLRPQLSVSSPRAAAGLVPPRRPQGRAAGTAPATRPGDRTATAAAPEASGTPGPAAASAGARSGWGRGGPGRTRAPWGRGHGGAGPARAGSARGGRSVLCGRRASWPPRCPATRPASKSRPRPCGCDGNGPGAWGPSSRPGGGPSRRPAEPLWRPGCPCAPIRRRAEAAARARPAGTPSPAWTTGRGPPRSLRTGRPRRRAR